MTTNKSDGNSSAPIPSTTQSGHSKKKTQTRVKRSNFRIEHKISTRDDNGVDSSQLPVLKILDLSQHRRFFSKQKKKHTFTHRNPPKCALSPPIYPLPPVLPTPRLVPSLSGSTSVFFFGALLWRYRDFKFKLCHYTKLLNKTCPRLYVM
jgi:hypothetical protein